MLSGKIDTANFNTKCDDFTLKENQLDKKITSLYNKLKEVESNNDKLSKFKNIEKSLMTKEEINKIIDEQILKWETNFILFKTNLQEFLDNNSCLTCGCLKGNSVISLCGEKGSKSILCIKCNENCLFCNNPATLTKENLCCLSCKRMLCSNCTKENAKIQKIFPKCSYCKKENYCMKCINLNGDNYCCPNCIIEINFSKNPELKYMVIIRENKNKWDFSNYDFQDVDIQNILFHLENSLTLSTISFNKLS